MRNEIEDGMGCAGLVPTKAEQSEEDAWRETERLGKLYSELLYAVASKHEGETRHETALRYIRERENQIEGPCMGAPAAPSESK